MVDGIAGDLFLEEIIPDALYSKICSARTPQEQMIELMRYVQQGGALVKSAFSTALRKHERSLVIDLGKNNALLSLTQIPLQHCTLQF